MGREMGSGLRLRFGLDLFGAYFWYAEMWYSQVTR